MPEEKPKMDKREALKVVDMKLEQFLVNQWYGKIIWGLTNQSWDVGRCTFRTAFEFGGGQDDNLRKSMAK